MTLVLDVFVTGGLWKLFLVRIQVDAKQVV